MASNQDILSMLSSIQANMATKSDMARLQQEVSRLCDENESQKDHIRCLRADVANLRAEANDLRAAARNEMCDGLEQIKDDVVRWGVTTQEELWEQETRAQKVLARTEDRDKKVDKTLVDIERGVHGLLNNEIRKIRDDMEEKTSRAQHAVPRKDSGVSLANEYKPTQFGFANGY